MSIVDKLSNHKYLTLPFLKAPLTLNVLPLFKTNDNLIFRMVGSVTNVFEKYQVSLEYLCEQK